MFGWFKKNKQKELLNEIINSKVKEQDTKTISKDIKIKKEEVVELKKPNHFSDCNCFKCLKWKRNAK
jgi:hypothetical protein